MVVAGAELEPHQPSENHPTALLTHEARCRVDVNDVH